MVKKCCLHALVLALCAPRSLPADQTAPLKLGLAASLTGNGAAFGRAESNGAQLAVEKINSQGGIDGRPLALVTEDTCGTAPSTVTAITKLAAVDKVSLIIGPTWLDSFQGAMEVAARHHTLLITPSGVAKNLHRRDSRRIFSTYYDAPRQMHFLVQQLRSAGKHHIALIFDDDPYSQLLAQTAATDLAQAGSAIVLQSGFAVGAVDFRAVLTRLKALSADAVLFGLVDEGAMLSLLKQRNLLLPTTPLYGPHDLEGYLQQPEFANLFHGVSYAAPVIADHAFAAAYTLRFGAPPLLTAANAYDAVVVITQALRAGCTTPDDISNYLHKESFPSVVFGEVRFAANGGANGGEYKLRAAD